MPESLAYATIAGVPPVVGLYAAVPALVLYAVLGSSRHLVVSPMSATAALSAGIVARRARPDDRGDDRGAVALTAGLLRLGFVASMISAPVLKGFIIGLALTILVGQLPTLFGVPSGDGSFFEKLWHLVTELDDTSVISLTVGLLSLALLLGLRRWAPKVPGSLVVVALAVVVASVFDLGDHGLELVGTIDAGLPPVAFPDVGLHRYLDLVGPAAGVMLVGFAEGLGAAKTYAAKAGTTSTATVSCSGSARPTSVRGCAAAWSSTAASRRRPSTAAPVPARSCPVSRRPCSRWSRCCS